MPLLACLATGEKSCVTSCLFRLWRTSAPLRASDSRLGSVGSPLSPTPSRLWHVNDNTEYKQVCQGTGKYCVMVRYAPLRWVQFRAVGTQSVPICKRWIEQLRLADKQSQAWQIRRRDTKSRQTEPRHGRRVVVVRICSERLIYLAEAVNHRGR